MTNHVECSHCGQTEFSTQTRVIDRTTGLKPVGMGSLLGGLALGVVGLFLLFAGLMELGQPATRGVPPWWQAVGLGVLFTYWGLVLLAPVARRDRVGLITSRCIGCGRASNQLADEENGPGATPLLEALQDDNAETRAAAAAALGNIGYLSFLKPLQEALEDDVASVRGAAAMALANLKVRSAIEPLLRMLSDEESWEAKGAAASGLALLGEPEVIKPIINTFKSAGFLSQDMFKSALESIRNPRALELLTQVHSGSDENLEIRMAAKKALDAIRERGLDSIGKKKEPWEPLVEASEIPEIQVEGAADKTVASTKTRPKPRIPAWAWVFAVACGSIPVMTLGGAIPGGIGLGGAAACVALARDTSFSILLRIAGCLGITVLCWALVFVVVGGFALLAA